MCKPEGRRKLEEGVGEEVRVEDHNMCFSAAAEQPHACGRETLQVAVRSERFMPCRLNTYQRLSTAQV